MSIAITCGCGKKFNVEDNLANQQVQCQCGNVFIVPEKPRIPWKHYYKLSWQQWKNRWNAGTQLDVLREEIICYWGFLIAEEAEDIGLEHFTPIQSIYREWSIAKVSRLGEQNPKKFDRLAQQTYRLSKEIGRYCWDKGYRYRKFSDIAPVEEQLFSLDTTLECQKMISHLWRQASRALPWFLRFSVLSAVLIVALVGISGYLLYLADRSLAAIVVGAIVASLLLPFMWKRFSLGREKKRLKRVWNRSLAQSGEDYISPEIVKSWVDAIFQKKWKKWQYSPPPAIEIPEDLSSGFIPDVMFSGDTIAEFGIEFDLEVENWAQSLYRFCSESFTEPGCVNLCFYHAEHHDRIPKFLHRLQQVLGEVNESEGRELIWVGEHSCTTPQRLGIFFSLLSPMFQESKFPADYHWKAACRLLHVIKTLVKIYDHEGAPSEIANHLKSQSFLEVSTGLRNCLYILAQRRPLLLVIEHLDHAEPATLNFLCDLTHGDRGHRMCFVVSYDRENVLRMPPLKESILILQRQNCWKTPEKQEEEHVLSSHLIGKAKAWQALEHCLRRTAEGPVLGVVGIQGESGQGKTFLMKRFLEARGTDYWTVYHNFPYSAWENPDSLLPFQPLLKIARESRTDLDPAVYERIAALADFLALNIEKGGHADKSLPWKRSGSDLVADKLANFDKDSLSPRDVVWKQSENLLEELTEVLCLLASHKPIALCFDNAHFADTATLKWILSTVNSRPNAPILVIFAWDPAAVGKTSINFQHFMREIQGKYQNIVLSKSDPKDVADYIAQEWQPNLLAETPESPFIQNLMKLTAGNVLLMTEFFKYLLAIKAIYPFGGFWVLKEEIFPQSLELERLGQQFVDTLPSEDQKLITALLREASVYGEAVPVAYLSKRLQEMGWAENDIHSAMNKLLPRKTLIKSSQAQGVVEFVHSQYCSRFFQSVPEEQRKELHQKVLDFLSESGSKDISFSVSHAEAAHSWEYVLSYSEMLGRHALGLCELTTAATIFDKAIYAAHNLEDVPALAKYYLLKARTFPSDKIKVTPGSLRNLLAKGEWQTALALAETVPDPVAACEIFLAFLENAEAPKREEVTEISMRLIAITANVTSEYERHRLLHRGISLFARADPLQLRVLVERSMAVVEEMYNPHTQATLYLQLERQLGEMDLDLVRVLSGKISPVRCGAGKTASLCYLASYLPKNPDMVTGLLEEAEEITNRVCRIMAYRGIAQNLTGCAPEQAASLFDRIAAFIADISVHGRRMEALESFLSGRYQDIQQQPFDTLVGSLPESSRLPIVHALLKIVQQTVDVPLRLQCLKRMAITLTRVAHAEGYKEVIDDLIGELKKLKNSGERGEGFLEIAATLLQENMNLAHHYLEEGLGEIEKMYGQEEELNRQACERVIGMLHQILVLLQKLPQPVVYPLWDRTIKIAQQMDAEHQDPLFSDMVVSLFPYDQEKSMQLATQIRTIKYRHHTVQNLLALPNKNVSIEILEKAILDYARDSYGYVLVQHLAEKDTGRARRLLRDLPQNLETQIASARLCKAPGQRVSEILKLSRGVTSDREIMSQILISLESLLRRKEYDQAGNQMLLETIPDSYLEKIPLLMALVFAVQEVDPVLACETFVRIPPLIEKHCLETEDGPAKILPDLEELLQQLQPGFIETYVDKMIPAVETISDAAIRRMFVKALCEKLKAVSPGTVLEILDKIADPQLHFQMTQGLETTRDISSSPAVLQFIEALTALSMVESVFPGMGQSIRQSVSDGIDSCPDRLTRMGLWLDVFYASGSWDRKFTEWAFGKILEEGKNIAREEIAPYCKMLDILRGFPVALRNQYLSGLIDYLTDHTKTIPPTSLCAGRNCFWNALRFLDALVPFGGSHMHSFVMKLLAIPKKNVNFTQTIECIDEFLFLSRGVAPDKECEWISEAIGYLDAAGEESDNPALQEDHYLLRALTMVQLSKSLIVYEPVKALQAAQRALQLTEYSMRRPRMHRYILLLLSSLMDVVQREIREKAPQLFKPIEIMRFQWSYQHLLALKGQTAEERKKCLQEEKGIAKEILCYLAGYLNGSLTPSDTGELEDAWAMAYQQFEKEIEECFDKVGSAQPGAGLTQAFFVIAQALCLMDDERLSSWRRIPWFQRLVRLAARLDPEDLSAAGDDLLQADEEEEFALLVSRVSLVYPKSVLFLIKALFSREKVSEISATLEDEAITEDLLKDMIKPLKNNALSRYRDRLLAELVLEWAEYDWGDGFLLVNAISDHELEATTIRRLVRKSCDFYPDDLSQIAHRALTALQKNRHCRARTAALEEVAMRLAPQDVLQALTVVSTMEPAEKRRDLLKKILSSLEFDQAFGVAAQVADVGLRVESLLFLLTGLPEESERRSAYLGRIWQMAQEIPEDDRKIKLANELVRIGIREKDLAEHPQQIAGMLMEMWENAGRSNQDLAFSSIVVTFPAFLRLLDNNGVRSLFQVLYHPENLPVPISTGLFKTVTL